MGVYSVRMVAALLIRGWLRLYHQFTIVGREHLPLDRSFVLVANHASHLDTLCLLSALPLAKLHGTFPVAARDYFFVSAPRLIAAAVVVNALPFERRINAWQSVELCRELLQNPGTILLLFPEGTRSVTGELGEFKPGVGLLVAGTSNPVVPCYLDGTHQAWPKDAWFPSPRRIQLTIGRPREYAHVEPSRASAVQISRELQEAVCALASL
jgi:1-acyl-sn-glycerol-3-phosphate acyltransferase